VRGVRLSGRLRDTTLGDLLGTVGRGGVTGVVTLTETTGPSAGRRHQVHFDRGAIVAIETDAEAVRGEDDDILERLAGLFRIADAVVQFHVLRVMPRGGAAARPLPAIDAVRGRPRARDRGCSVRGFGDRDDSDDDSDEASLAPLADGRRSAALRVLGLDEHADPASIRRAFRALAARVHPDRATTADRNERRRLEQTFAELSSAYHVLMG
jgi:DnaJ-domain-containing protein 1